MIKYTLYRIEDDETTTAISSHDSIVEGMVAGGEQVEQHDHDYAYRLVSSGGSKIATFCEGRIGYRMWAHRAGRLHSPITGMSRSEDEYIHALDDRYQHDLDEMGVGH